MTPESPVPGMRVVVASVAVALLLAGCSDGGDPKTDSVSLGDTQVDFGDAGDFSQTTGAIRGVVVDEAIRPLGNVTVNLQPKGVNATTDAGGVFAFDNLEPGVYFLAVGASPGLLGAQTSADVVAGEATTVRILLQSDGSPQAYHYTLSFEWYDGAGVAIVDFAIDLFDDSLLGDSLPPQCERCFWEFVPDGPVSSMILEATWDVTVPNPTGDVDWYWMVEDRGDGGSYEDDYCPQPCYVDVPLGSMGNATLYGLKMSSDERWITYQQQAQIFLTMFYVGPAPEGWSFLAGDP